MNILLLIFIGAGLGGVCRYAVSNATYLFLNTNFPYGTLIVNVSGCFIMGILFVFILDRLNEAAPQLRALLLVGFLGGYTTFSSFSIETISLLENAEYMKAFLNIFLSTTLCLIAAWAGVIIGRQI